MAPAGVETGAGRAAAGVAVSAVLAPLLIVVATVAATEAMAALIHRHVMHGFGWGWHRSHHEPRQGWFEVNDLYALVFAALSVVLMLIGHRWPWALWMGVGLVVYGILYTLAHDGLVHRRWPFRHVPRRGYLKRLYQAHKLHHAVEGREGCVSFGFLYAPPVERLREGLRAGEAARAPGPAADRPTEPVPR